jgi:hypothetical protein
MTMANKLDKDTFPSGSTAADFDCFGPPATVDGDFETVKIADLGCFTQDGKDTNKYYHGAVVQHKTKKDWYAYFEWGRTGAAHPSFQFVACQNQDDAQHAFASQLHSKNDGRGQWVTVAGLRTLQARAGKDCYLVRPMATRSTGLPDARSIKINEGAKPKPKPEAESATKKSSRKSVKTIDDRTRQLLTDLSVATIAYTRGSMADESLPTQNSIDEARTILGEASKRLAKVGDDVKKQVIDKELIAMTSLMYGRIPRRKALHAKPEDWLLTKDNILVWQNDLDAFESALDAIEFDPTTEVDPLSELNIEMDYVAPDSTLGKKLYPWWPVATANRHSHIGEMKIRNLWQVRRKAVAGKLDQSQAKVISGKTKITERALHQPKTRFDLTPAERKVYTNSNTALLFHGTRSVNVRGIMKESLRMPKELVGVVITGAMFGPGLYFADDWKKSAGYTSLTNSYWSRGSGSVARRGAFMFAMDVCLGVPHVAPQAHGFTEPPAGHHCIFGKAGVSGVQNNEYIVFDTGQQQMRYLVEFEV